MVYKLLILCCTWISVDPVHTALLIASIIMFKSGFFRPNNFFNCICTKAIHEVPLIGLDHAYSLHGRDSVCGISNTNAGFRDTILLGILPYTFLCRMCKDV